jgi:futalosine hydrolase
MDKNMSSKYSVDFHHPDAHVLIVASVPGELAGIEKEMAHRKILNIGCRKVIEGELFSKLVRLIVTGPGQVNAVQALTAAIESSPPALIIQTGCAGGFPMAGIEIGDIGIAIKETDAHLGIESADESIPILELPFPVFEIGNKKLTNRYPICRSLAESAFQIVCDAPPSESTRVFKGNFVTVSTVTATDCKARQLYSRFEAIMETMEGAGAALVAIVYNLPYLQIRSVSNTVGNRRRNEWNLPMAFKHASMAVLQVVRNFDCLANHLRQTP